MIAGRGGAKKSGETQKEREKGKSTRERERGRERKLSKMIKRLGVT